LPGHNEEIIIETTIASALAAGQSIDDIYVVDDASSDQTSKKALNLLPASQVLRVRRSGKAVAVQKAIKKFHLDKRYTWLHVADADSVFCPQYFDIYRSRLDPERFAAAVGFVQSMRGNWIARYRCFNYTYGQHIFRRIQGWFNMISVLPGPVTCFRTDILKQLEFNSGSLTEDFDLTLQIHRKKLGRIRFIPEAVNFTQGVTELAGGHSV
jgi:cellulose synthase/poly-beta-1,6-N-acetylglucosamine synthase-like glycosyltransferase